MFKLPPRKKLPNPNLAVNPLKLLEDIQKQRKEWPLKKQRILRSMTRVKDTDNWPSIRKLYK